MKAVFTFSTEFFNLAKNGGFLDNEAFATSIVLSTEQAKKTIGRTEVYTDSVGARLLDKLDVRPDSVHIVYDGLAYDPSLWVASKLKTFIAQDEPFAHIDLDAYLWEPLPCHVSDAAVFAQNSENNWASYDAIMRFFVVNAGYIPPFFKRHVEEHGLSVVAMNAGIYGGNDLEAVNVAAWYALRTIEHPANAPMFKRLTKMYATGNRLFDDMPILLEQCFSAVYCRENGIKPAFVVEEDKHQYFSHLMAESKRHTESIAAIKNRVLRDYPERVGAIRDWHKHCVNSNPTRRPWSSYSR